MPGISPVLGNVTDPVAPGIDRQSVCAQKGSGEPDLGGGGRLPAVLE